MGQTFRRREDSKIAVVIHLFYPELWGQFQEHLQLLGPDTYDLYITVPPDKQEAARAVISDFPNTTLVVSPNRGRDVLPFLKLVPALDQLGYSVILKLHTKKSPHWDGGTAWRDELLSALLPEDASQLRDILEILDKPQTGMVGPEGHYIALAVNYPANRRHIKRILSDITSEDVSQKIDANLDDYGFFGGSMFWSRMESLRPLIAHRYGSRVFEAEAGQVDGTFAHAIERVFSLLLENKGLELYSSGVHGIQKVKANSGTIPEWSDLHPSNKT